jgi:hypothetical protein
MTLLLSTFSFYHPHLPHAILPNLPENGSVPLSQKVNHFLMELADLPVRERPVFLLVF